MPEHDKRQRLDSWKAIARHLGRSVRTVRRWEQHEGLPVHRQMHRSRASVYAWLDELDAWRERSSDGPVVQLSAPAPEPRERARQPRVMQRSIVVMPMGFAGADPGQAWIADGVSEELINSLSGIGGLRVISRTSSLSLLDGRQDARGIGDMLKVSHLLEGSVVSDGKRLRVSVRLIDTGSDERIWSQRFDGAMDQAFDMLAHISRDVAGALRLRLSQSEQLGLASRSIDNPETWRLLVESRQAALGWSRDSIDLAMTLLRQALDLSGESVVLCAALGRTALQYREAGISQDAELIGQARAWAQRAAAIEPDAADTRQLQGWIHYVEGEIPQAVAELQKARVLSPNNADTLGLLANCLLIAGQMRPARSVVEQLLAVDPLTPLSRCMPGWADALDGRFAEAIPPYRAMYEGAPANPIARLFYIWILVLNNRSELALDLVEQYPEAQRETAPARIARLLAAASNKQDMGPLTAPRNFSAATTNEMFPRLLAQAYALADQPNAALPWLQLAVQRGFSHYPYLARHDPFFRGYWSRAGWDALLKDVQTRWEAFA